MPASWPARQPRRRPQPAAARATARTEEERGFDVEADAGAGDGLALLGCGCVGPAVDDLPLPVYSWGEGSLCTQGVLIDGAGVRYQRLQECENHGGGGLREAGRLSAAELQALDAAFAAIPADHEAPGTGGIDPDQSECWLAGVSRRTAASEEGFSYCADLRDLKVAPPELEAVVRMIQGDTVLSDPGPL
jgi:hypothetical protein